MLYEAWLKILKHLNFLTELIVNLEKWMRNDFNNFSVKMQTFIIDSCKFSEALWGAYGKVTNKHIHSQI